MLAVLFLIALIWGMWKLVFWGFKTAWTLTKILETVLFFPLLIMVFACKAFVSVAVPVLILASILALIGRMVFSQYLYSSDHNLN